MVSRRTLLKSIGVVGLAVAAGKRAARNRTYAQIPTQTSRWLGQPIGRISGAYLNIRAEPTTDSEAIGTAVQDELFRVRRVVEGQAALSHNNLWLETKFGYLYSSFVQPIWNHLPNVPERELGDGRWAQVTVPYTDAFWEPDARDESRFVDTFYYGSTVRVEELVTGEDGHFWYKVRELYQSFYLRATHVRIMGPDELSPLSPEVPVEEKVIEVILSQQLLIAYEYGEPVFRHKVSTGLPEHATPTGEFYVFDKRLSERMVGGTAADEATGDRYNLGGVPFTSYFTGNWVALHGCYWHNDYGIQRSRGCVNLPPAASRFLWRWTTPAITDDYINEMFVRPRNKFDGTKVRVWA